MLLGQEFDSLQGTFLQPWCVYLASGQISHPYFENEGSMNENTAYLSNKDLLLTYSKLMLFLNYKVSIQQIEKHNIQEVGEGWHVVFTLLIFATQPLSIVQSTSL